MPVVGIGLAVDRLVLVRHSLPVVSPDVEPFKWPLSREGRLRSLALASELRSFEPRVIFCSHEAKASESARIVASRLGVVHRAVDGLQEHERSSVDFAPSPGEFETKLARFFDEPETLVFGRETAEEAKHRFCRAVSGLIPHRRQGVGYGEALCVVSHGTVISLFVAAACAIDPMGFWRNLGQPSYVVMSLPELALLSVVRSVESAGV